MTLNKALTVEQRLDHLESRSAIQDLVSGYALGFDRHDLDLVLSVFHDDAEYLMPGLFGEFRGHGEIRRAYEDVVKAVPDTWHFTTNLIVKLDGDRATGVSEVNMHGTDSSGRPILLAAAYIDEYQRRSGRWAISRRVVETQYLTGLFQGWGLSKESKFPQPQ